MLPEERVKIWRTEDGRMIIEKGYYENGYWKSTQRIEGRDIEIINVYKTRDTEARMAKAAHVVDILMAAPERKPEICFETSKGELTCNAELDTKDPDVFWSVGEIYKLRKVLTKLKEKDPEKYELFNRIVHRIEVRKEIKDANAVAKPHGTTCVIGIDREYLATANENMLFHTLMHEFAHCEEFHARHVKGLPPIKESGWIETKGTLKPIRHELRAEKFAERMEKKVHPRYF